MRYCLSLDKENGRCIRFPSQTVFLEHSCGQSNTRRTVHTHPNLLELCYGKKRSVEGGVISWPNWTRMNLYKYLGSSRPCNDDIGSQAVGQTGRALNEPLNQESRNSPLLSLPLEASDQDKREHVAIQFGNCHRRCNRNVLNVNDQEHLDQNSSSKLSDTSKVETGPAVQSIVTSKITADSPQQSRNALWECSQYDLCEEACTSDCSNGAFRRANTESTEQYRAVVNSFAFGDFERLSRRSGKAPIWLEGTSLMHSASHYKRSCDDYAFLRTPSELQRRIISLEKQLAHAKGSNEHPFLSVQSGVVGARLHEAFWLPRESFIYELGYPYDDSDVDECFYDAQGISAPSAEVLKTELFKHLRDIRDGALASAMEMRLILFGQTKFRAVSKKEVVESISFVVQNFVSAREQTIEKFRVYVRTRRWIESVTNRRKKGGLSTQQNNILRYWLFSNFKNPYPNSEDKKKLILETKLNISQVNNWLINARSRIWKPTVDCICTERKKRRIVSSISSVSRGKRQRISPEGFRA